MYKRSLTLPVLLVLLGTVATACGKPTSAPLFQAVPTLDEVPRFTPLAMREVPQPTRESLQLRLEPGGTAPSGDNVVNSPGAARGNGDRRPSVIISVPAEATQAARAAAELRAQGRAPLATQASTGNGLDQVELESFRTDGYYNQAEQQVETALLRQGFDVLDRAKFEAKLRDMRDRQAEGLNSWLRRYSEVAMSAGSEVALTMLRRELETGVINLAEFQEASREIERSGQLSLPGQRRLEDEMIDIAEVIRAAQTGEERADYLLQISGVRVENSANRQFNIANFAETRAFLDRNPGLQIGSGPGVLPAAIPARWFRAEFNAKLIDVQTGSIVWLGNHTLESRHAEPITVTIPVERSVANGDAVTRALRQYNEEGTRLQTEASQVRQQLDRLYAEAQSPQTFENREALAAWEERMRQNVATQERRFRDLREALAAHQSRRPEAYEAPWEFAYSVSEPQVEPNLTDFAANDRAAQERLEQHRSNLIRELTRSLISTITVF